MDQINSLALRQAVDDYLDSLIRNLPSEQELTARQAVSPRFKRRMQYLIRKARRLEARRKTKQGRSVQRETRIPLRHRKRLLAMVILIAILTSAFSISASREAIVGFVVQIYEKFSTIVFNNPTESTTVPSISGISDAITDQLPADLPKGYKITDQSNLIGFIQIIYVNESGQELIFTKQEKGGLRIDIDTEGIQTETVLLDPYQGIYYTNKGQNSLIWEDDQFAYSIIGIITKEEMITMAISTK